MYNAYVVFFHSFLSNSTSVPAKQVQTRSVMPTGTMKATHDEQYEILLLPGEIFCLSL